MTDDAAVPLKHQTPPPPPQSPMNEYWFTKVNVEE
jgi:hypothetical protein